MVYQIVLKKRFQNKLEHLLIHIESEFGVLIAQKFAKQLDKKFLMLQQQPFIGLPSAYTPHVRSIHAGKHNRLNYRMVRITSLLY